MRSSGPQEVVAARDAVGRVAAESLAAYPPGIPNVLPGERLTAETLDYIEQTIAHGGSLRGASDRALRTLRVVVESQPTRSRRIACIRQCAPPPPSVKGGELGVVHGQAERAQALVQVFRLRAREHAVAAQAQPRSHPA